MAPPLIRLRTHLVGPSVWGASAGSLYDIDLSRWNEGSRARLGAALARWVPELRPLGRAPALLVAVAALADAMLDALGLALGPCAAGEEAGDAGSAWVFLAAPREDVAEALARGVEAVLRKLPGSPAGAVTATLEKLVLLWDNGEVNPRLYERARSAGLPARFLSRDGDTLLLGTGARRRLLQNGIRIAPGGLDAVVEDKLATSRWLAQAGIPCTHPTWVGSPREAVAAARAIGYPVVVKPARAARQVGVFTGLACDEDVAFAFRRSQKSAGQYASWILVEKHNPGRYARATLVGGRLEALLVSRTPTVRGDGKSTALELVKRALELEPRDRVEDRGMAMLEGLLRTQGLGFRSVPRKGARVVVGLSNHGKLTEATAHPTLRAILRRVASLFPLPALGVDLLMRDPMGPFDPERDVVLEVNTRPALFLGNPKGDVGGSLLRHLFPGGAAAVPVVGAGRDGRRDLLAFARELAARGVRTAGYAERATWTGAPGNVVGRGADAARLLGADPGAEVLLVALDDELLGRVGLPVPRIDYVVGGWPAGLERRRFVRSGRTKRPPASNEAEGLLGELERQS